MMEITSTPCDDELTMHLVCKELNLWLSGMIPANNVQLLKQNNIKYVLSLGVTVENQDPSIEYLHLGLPDHPTFNMLTSLPECFFFMDQATKNGDGLLVHCHLGQSRSPTVTLSYMMHKLQLDLDEAWYRVESQRRSIWPNIGFKIQLRCYERWKDMNLDFAKLDIMGLLIWHLENDLQLVKTHISGLKRISCEEYVQIQSDVEDLKAYKVSHLCPALISYVNLLESKIVSNRI